ncbi:DNA annealing helicase and endonuclease ZRANB3-like isoform X3 [Dreissena polymorpha]|nr:DNA annealing helicase and endonuclease ZRANB3-like isoform X3 [Dreissena polymorpha]
MPFQKQGVQFAVKKNGRCLIADEMGLGKTLQAISVAYYYKDEWPLLVIVPSSLRFCWIEEFEKWLPDIDPASINLVQSGSDVSEIGTSQITIATFGLLSKATSRLLKEALFSQGFKVVIVDESHYIRNIQTASAKTVVPLIKNANRRILLSGTPALARPVELYPQIDAICPDKFGSWWHYTARYCDAKIEWIGKVKRRNVNGASNLQELQGLLCSELMIRREKAQVLTQLPPKQRQKVLFELKDSDLKKEIRSTFEELQPLLRKRAGQDRFEVLTGAGSHVTKDTNMLSLISRLYQLSGEAKIGPAKEYVEMLCENPKLKFLVFAYHHAMMNGLSESLHDKHVKFIRIDGETPPSERPHLVHQFQSDPDTRVAVLSILAAGVGLTFTAATLVVFAEMYWTPGTMVQCEDRAHRIGQSSCVAVHYLVAKDTMDEWVWSAVCKKTIVTSTTLTGRKSELKAADGDRYQVDVLSNAEVWVPSTNQPETNVTQYLQTQLEPDQPSILDFFAGAKQKHNTPGSSTKRSFLDTIDQDISCIDTDTDGDALTQKPWKRQRLSDVASVETCETKNNSLSLSSYRKSLDGLRNQPLDCIVIDDEEDVFVSRKTENKTGKKHKANTRKSFSHGKTNKSVVSEDMNAGKWSCTACTFLNHADLKSCEMCETKRTTKKTMLKEDNNHIEAEVCEKADVGKRHVCSDDRNNVMRISEISKSIHSELMVEDKCSEVSDVVSKGGNSTVGCSYSDLEIEPEDGVDLHCGVDIDNYDDTENENTHIKTQNHSKSDLSNIQNTLPVEAAGINKENIGIFKRDQYPHTPKSARKKYRFRTPKSSQSPCPEIVAEGSPASVPKNYFFIPSPLRTPRSSSQESGGSVNKTGVNLVRESLDFSSVSSQEEISFRLDVDTELSEQVYTEHESIPVVKDDSENLLTTPLDKGSAEEYTFSSPEVEDMMAAQPTDVPAPSPEKRMVDIDCIPVYNLFYYVCSKYTGRVYLLTPDRLPLNVNFVPTDVEVGNLDGLPDVLIHPANLKHVQRFVREWNSLSETKRRLLVKSSAPFISPLQEYERLKSCKNVNIQRYKSKADVSKAAHHTAESIQGSVRQLHKPGGSVHGTDKSSGTAQVVSQDGTPHCVQCMKPYRNQLLQTTTIVNEENAWQTRFCSQTCSQQYWMLTNTEYIRDQVFEVEHGICQMCKLDAHSLFKHIRDTRDIRKRAEILGRSPLVSLSVKVRQQMVTKPTPGLFWHVDHIIPVWEGGGQCNIDNLRTLCVRCHNNVTATQASKRATVRKLGTAVRSRDITAFFQKS